ncbi:MAG: hypothetical protein NTZ49_05720 [Candidatus Parcubacteria bacterium]|nr:hypothetical protein [Candidatus Parcubacteria bacterium]
MRRKIKKDKHPKRAFRLANFILVVESQKLLVTSEHQEDIEVVLEDFSRNNPEQVYIKKDFAVKPLIISHQRNVSKWKQIPGFSLWVELK